jgi:hypothetical protein
VGGLSLMGVNSEHCIGDIFVDIVVESLLASGVFGHESRQIEHLILVEEKTFFERFGVGDPLFFTLYH